MWTERVELVQDVSAAAWIGELLTTTSSAITSVIPAGFDRYCRILHPVPHGADAVTWAHVADRTGAQVHGSVQWHALIGADSPLSRGGDLWDGPSPQAGNLALDQLLALCDVLAEHTDTPDDCYFAMWDGWGHLHGPRPRTRAGSRAEHTIGWATKDGGPLLTPDDVAAERLHLPGRSYVVFRGPLSTMGELAQYDGPSTGLSQSPALFWPADRTWLVATEIDFDSTLVGGSHGTVAAVRAAPALEAVPIGLDASLRAGGDTVNQTP